jgi:hypothetical protein
VGFVEMRAYFRNYIKSYGKSLEKLTVQSRDDYRLLNVLIAYAIVDCYAAKRIKALKSLDAQRIINLAAEFLNEDQYDYSYWTAAIMVNLKRKCIIAPPASPVGAEYCKADIEKLIHGYMTQRYIRGRKKKAL